MKHQADPSRETVRSLVMEASRLATWSRNLVDDTMTLSPLFARILGIDRNVLSSRDWRGRILAQDMPQLDAALIKARRENGPIDVEFRVARADGSPCWLLSRGIILKDGEDRPVRAIGVAIDISDIKQAQDRLRLMDERIKLVIEGTGEGIWDWDLDKGAYILSGGVKQILGLDKGECSGAPLNWLDIIHPDDQRLVTTEVKAHLQGNIPVYQTEYRVLAKDGSWKWVASKGVVVARDPSGRALAMTGIMSDISARKASEEAVWKLANLDPLTGLPNRRHFQERLKLALERGRQDGRAVGLLFIDLDRFKDINDISGHEVGDRLLGQAARRIEACIGEDDMVARVGGDEFTVVLHGLGEPGRVERVCERVLSCLADPFPLGGEAAYLSGSIGIAMFPEDASAAEELVRKADQAMYVAKDNGRNQFVFFTKAMDEAAQWRSRMISELRQALERGQLCVHFQPIVALASGRVTKAEALVRWNHPQFGMVSPAEFIPLAEGAGLIGDIGDWVFRQSAAHAARWRVEFDAHFQVSINRSPKQFQARQNGLDWLGHLRSIGLPGSGIAIEITEGVLLHACAEITKQIMAYRSAGIEIAIDDFGTGYSSLSYLQKFAADYLKIDRSFVSRMTVDAGNRAIAEAIIVMAHKLGMKVVAEGVETEEQRQILLNAGCDYAQGFLFSRPVQVEAFEALLRDAQPLAGGERAAA